MAVLASLARNEILRAIALRATRFAKFFSFVAEMEVLTCYQTMSYSKGFGGSWLRSW
jgi:hypothetical protein